MPHMPLDEKTSIACERMVGLRARTRRAGVMLAVSGTLLLALAAGDVPAGEIISGTEGDDRIHGLPGADGISGGAGRDEIYGGPGRDVMLGGPGDDFIEAKDGERDFVACGAGRDVASVDERDRVSRDCEIVYRS